MASKVTDIQYKSLMNLDFDTALDIWQFLANERLGITDVDDYCKIMDLAPRTAYHYMDTGKIKTAQLGKHKYPIINDK
jgi:hypothetical protein